MQKAYKMTWVGLDHAVLTGRYGYVFINLNAGSKGAKETIIKHYGGRAKNWCAKFIGIAVIPIGGPLLMYTPTEWRKRNARKK